MFFFSVAAAGKETDLGSTDVFTRFLLWQHIERWGLGVGSVNEVVAVRLAQFIDGLYGSDTEVVGDADDDVRTIPIPTQTT